MSRVLGAVLAGGQSRRFGSDKAAALLGGERLIDRVLAAMSPQVDALIVCGRDMLGVTWIADRPQPDLGPLGGLCAALHHAREHGFAEVVTVPCDTPFLPCDVVERLAVQKAAYAASLPVIGRWPSILAETLEQHLVASDDRSMRLWVRTIAAVPIPLDGLANINTVADLHRMTALRP